MSIPGLAEARRAVSNGWTWRSAFLAHIAPEHWAAALEQIPEHDREDARVALRDHYRAWKARNKEAGHEND